MDTNLSQRTGARLVSADRVEGAAVFNRDGEHLGTIDKVFIDKVSGQAEFASMAFGGVLGVGARHHPLPWSMLTYDPACNGFVIDCDKALLEGAPSYDDDRMRAADASWAPEVWRYFAFE